MKEQNSYAYIGNTKIKVAEKEGKKTVILSGFSPKECIKGIFEKEKIEELESNLTKLVFTTEVNLDQDFFEVKVTLNNVRHSFYVDIEVNGKTKTKVITCLENIHKKLEESDLNKKDDYIQVITYDAISEYYCNKIFRALAGFERKLRNLMLSIYLVHFEKNYYEHQFDEALKEKIKKGVQANKGSRQNEIKRIKEAFYSIDFNTIEDMLFTSKFTEYEVKKINKTLSRTKDLSTLSDLELRSLIRSFLPKSDWDRFFADKINGRDFKEILSRIRNNRNKVAHQKFFYKKDYLELKQDLRIFTEAIDRAIEITKDEEFSKQNREYMSEVFEGIQDSLKPLLESVGRIASRISEYVRETTSPLTKLATTLSNSIYVPRLKLTDLSIYEDESNTEDDEESETDDESTE